jgi:hypothetical protein
MFLFLEVGKHWCFEAIWVGSFEGGDYGPFHYLAATYKEAIFCWAKGKDQARGGFVGCHVCCVILCN